MRSSCAPLPRSQRERSREGTVAQTKAVAAYSIWMAWRRQKASNVAVNRYVARSDPPTGQARLELPNRELTRCAGTADDIGVCGKHAQAGYGGEVAIIRDDVLYPLLAHHLKYE